MSTHEPTKRGGLGAIDAESFDIGAAVGGWRGLIESVAPTLVFVAILALRPTALLPAILASLALSAIALIARLLARQGLTQVLSGAVLALISAAWAWRSGQASNFYATGLLINAVWLVVTAGSILVRRPLVGLLIGLWHSTRTGPDHRPQRPTAGEQRRHTLATAVLAGMFALRLVVEVPLYLAGASALGALGVARLVLGVPLYLVCVWLAWLIARPRPQRERR
ncbi:DUF3159 domain-containing protein [Actinomyces bowdenii]|uniref:DUF3159 domain-containing protein n=1 Tax=Actinomyces bowdenii TaxID=131109 RepID=A0A853ELZ9_9ACTO|nr:DUF3159 domain-containing protein [Actinomyces bowdenii]MBF0698011.1 DUF3159 domain-containing protein [Actinomyces bowdenii]MCR2051884.1 DUF3159 domain-containing protein [Actinomyces bowdenii]MDO5064971.1 DUF3159 domain-containing protein [Actinomyces bowdenii]NYS70184.1 DUF3159 domain-containing protein [Actinomyces bowdenii]